MHKNHNQQIFILAVLTLTVSLLWIYLSVYSTLKGKSEKPILTKQEIELLNPKLDHEVFEELILRNQ